MKLGEDVTRDMLLNIVELFLEDLEKEGKEAEEKVKVDKSDVYSKDVSLVYQQVGAMLRARLSTLEY